jgi:hypothetical protein
MEAFVWSHDEAGESRFLGGMHDPFMPLFNNPSVAGSHTIVKSEREGSWSEVFGESSASDVLVVRHDVILSGNVTANVIVVADGGRLSFSRTADSRLFLTTLQVLEGGTLDIGTTESPIASANVEIVFADAVWDYDADPGQYGHGLIVLGTVRMHGSSLSRTYVEADGEIYAGDQAVSVADDLVGWRVGNKVLLPDSRQNFSSGTSAEGYNEIATVSRSDSRIINLTQPLANEHMGARGADGSLVFSPYVANLSRNIVLRSENPLGVRGHTMFIGRADVDIRYVEFRDLGRTTNNALDNTQFDSLGAATRIGLNQESRYAVHFHHLIGPQTPPANGKQFTFMGNSIYNDGPAVKWAIVIHGSHYGLVSRNVVYNIEGAGIVTEDGSESYNVISENLISRISGTRDRGKVTDGREGSGIWLRRPNSYLDNNVVTGAAKAGYAIYGSDNNSPAPLRIPAFQGADPHHGYFEAVEAESMVLQSFNGNVAYANSIGVELWYYAFHDYYNPSLSPVAKTVFADLELWHNSGSALVAFQANSVLIENATIIGDTREVHRYNWATGLFFENAVNTSIINSRIENYQVGIQVPARVSALGRDTSIDEITPFEVQGGWLNNQINIYVETPRQDAFEDFPPRAVVIKGVDFELVRRFDVPPSNLSMNYRIDRFSNLVQKDVVEVYDYDRTGTDFRVFYAEQEPSFVIPRTGSRGDLGSGTPLGAPEDGLTNALAFALHGLAIAGEVAPGDASHFAVLPVPAVDGLVFPINYHFLPPAILFIRPDTGVSEDYVTSFGDFEIGGMSQPESLVEIVMDDLLIGTTQADSEGRWVYKNATLAKGDYRFRIRSRLGADVSDLSFPRGVSVRNSPPEITNAAFRVYSDAPKNASIGNLLIRDDDLGDSHSVRILSGNEGGNVSINDNGAITALQPLISIEGQSLRLTVRVTDSAGLDDLREVEIVVARRSASDWVPLLHYSQFYLLNAYEAVYLTPDQVASIPNAYTFSQMSNTARAALTAEQVSAIRVAPLGMLSLLTSEQLTYLSNIQVQELSFHDFAFLTAELIPSLSLEQISTIPSAFQFSLLSSTARAALTPPQVRSLRIAPEGTVRLLTNQQIDLLSDSQVQTLSASDFSALTVGRITALTTEQVGTISSAYSFSLIPVSVRHSLLPNQLIGLRVEISGLIALLAPVQRQILTFEQIRRLGYSDFSFLPSDRVFELSDMQLYSIPSKDWFYSFSEDSRRGLLTRGVRWVDGIGVIIE